MTRTRGIALVAGLIVLLVAGALAAGAFFLTSMNLDIAQNTRSNVIARSNAESGLESSYVALYQSVSSSTDGEFPAAMSTSDVPGAEIAMPFREEGPYELLSYQTFADAETGLLREARLVVRGYGPRDAEHESEMLVHVATGGGDASSYYTRGLSSKQTVTIEDDGYIDGNVHGDAGYKLEGAVTITGAVTASEDAWADDTCTPAEGDSADTQQCMCKSELESGADWCDGVDGSPTNQVAGLDIDEPDIVADYWTPQQPGGTDSAFPAPTTVACTGTLTLTQSEIDALGAATRYQGCDVVLAGDVTLAGKALWLDDDRRLTISDSGGVGPTITDSQLAAGEIFATGSATFESSDLFALSTDENSDFEDTEVLGCVDSANCPALRIDSADITFSGDSTVASAGGIKYEGSTSFDCEDADDDGVCDCLATLEGCAEEVGLLVVADGSIKAENQTELIGVFMAGNRFKAENDTRIVGGVVTFGPIKVENDMVFYDPGSLSNSDLNPGDTPSVLVDSRR